MYFLSSATGHTVKCLMVNSYILYSTLCPWIGITRSTITKKKINFVMTFGDGVSWETRVGIKNCMVICCLYA